MKPVEIGVIFAITPFACSLSSLGSAWVARRFGRINAIIVAHMTGTVLLVVFAACTTVRIDHGREVPPVNELTDARRRRWPSSCSSYERRR